MAFQGVIFLFAGLVAFILYRIIFRENISWNKLIFKSKKKSIICDQFSKKLRNTSLYKTILKRLDLEEDEFTHFNSIGDNFKSFQELSSEIRASGLESSNIILGIDFTASNEWQGRNTFDNKSLHHISKHKRTNPYQQVISTIAATLEPFDDDNLIPTYGFGDVTTKDHDVFSFNSDGYPCKGFTNVLDHYEEIVKDVNLSGPTSFAPIINKAIDITKELNSYHILVIIADGQVENKQDEDTRKAIIEASFYPLSIIVVGVGDGPWDNMITYDVKLASRHFDNFQFVNYHDCIKNSNKSPEINFALHALMEIPDQYKTLISKGILKSQSKKENKLSDRLDNPLNKGNNNGIHQRKKSLVHNLLQKLNSHSL